MVNWHRKWAVFGFCKISKISQSQIMIESDHKSWTLFLSPRQKVGGGKWWARTQKTFYAAQNLKIIFKSNAFLQNSLRDFRIFQYFTHFEFLKNALPIIKKKCVMNFQKSKIWDVHFFVFPCQSSWYMTFFPYPKLSGGKLA